MVFVCPWYRPKVQSASRETPIWFCSQPHPRNAFVQRTMEALTDGIFAIAMTLLVLELKVPELPKSVSTSELLQSLRHEGPAFISFMVSFLYCGVLWMMHHLAMHFIRHIQIGLVWLNLLFLMSISVLPFSCALLGHFF